MSTITSTFNYCTPTSASASATYTTTVYEVIFPACDGYNVWDATYTITDYCEDECHGYIHGGIPPGFQVSTVHCPVCPTPEVVITCPTVVPAHPTGVIPPPYIHGNGVTAPCDCEEEETAYTHPNNGTPTITVYDTCTGNSCAPPPTNPPGPVYPPPPAPPVNGNGYPAPPPPAQNSGYPAPPPAQNSGYPVPPPAQNSGHPAPPPVQGGGYPAAPPPVNGNGYPAPAPPANGGSNYPAVPAGSTKPSSPYQTAPPPVVVAGATSVSRSLGLISGLAAIAGYVYLL